MADTKPLAELSQPQPPPLPASEVDALIGQNIDGFLVEAAMAAGGMGIVYRAVHPVIGRKVAVKVLRPEVAADAEQVDRFLKEAQALSAIKHRGIIEIIGFGNLPDGRQYMTMEFLEGQSLEEVMAKEAPMSPARVLALMDEVLNALSAAHKVGVVHRDLKPSNVFIAMQSNGEKNVKLLDFGLAKHSPVTLEQVNDGALDKSSVMAGTPEYIAPEQARGLAPSPVTDVYSLGVVAFEMAGGQLPFKADSVVEMLTKHVREEPPRLSSLVSSTPADFDELINQMLRKQPEDRPASAELCRQSVQRISRALRNQATQVRVNPLLSAAEQTSAPAPALTPEPMAAASAGVTGPMDRVPSIPLATVKPDRRPVIAALVLLIIAVLVWLFWPRGSGVTTPPQVAVVQPAPVPVAPTPEVKPPSPPVEEQPPVVEAKPAVVEPDLIAPLEKVEPKPKVPAEKTKLSVTVNDPKPNVVVEDVNCVPDATWRADQTERLRDAETQIKERLSETNDTDGLLKLRTSLSALRKDLEATKTPAQCEKAVAKIDDFIRAQLRKR